MPPEIEAVLLQEALRPPTPRSYEPNFLDQERQQRLAQDRADEARQQREEQQAESQSQFTILQGQLEHINAEIENQRLEDAAIEAQRR